jgi:hypothetical protein
MDKVSKEEEANGDGQVVELAQEGAPEAHPTFSFYSVMSFLDIEDRATTGHYSHYSSRHVIADLVIHLLSLQDVMISSSGGSTSQQECGEIKPI